MAKKSAKGSDKLKLELINSKGLVNFLTKFKDADKSKSLVIILNSEKLEVRVLNPNESVFKVSSLPFEQIFSPIDFEETLYLGIFNFEKFNKIFSFIDDDVLEFIIHYTKADNYAYKIEIKNSDVQKIYATAPKGINAIMSDDSINIAINTDDAFVKFDLDSQLLNKIRNLISLEVNSLFSITLNNNKLYFMGREFKILYKGEIEIFNEMEEEIVISNENMAFLDKENYNVFLKEQGIIFTSKDSETIIGIARAEEDMEHYTEDN